MISQVTVSPIGTTTVTCGTTGIDATPSTGTRSFTVTVTVPNLRFDAHACGSKTRLGRFTCQAAR